MGFLDVLYALDGTRAEVRSDDVYAVLERDELRVGNRLFERAWRVASNGLLYARSFVDKTTGREWIRAEATDPSPTSAAPVPDEPRTVELTGDFSQRAVGDSVPVRLVATGTISLTYDFELFANTPGVRVRLTVPGLSGQAADLGPTYDAPTGTELADRERAAQQHQSTTDTLDAFAVNAPHLRLTQVVFHDQTDVHNKLVFESEWLLHPSETSLALTGCLFYVEDVLTESGLIFVKEAPLPKRRPVSSPADLRIWSGERRFAFCGQGADETGEGCAFATLAYSKGKWGRIAALQHYQRSLRPYQSRTRRLTAQRLDGKRRLYPDDVCGDGLLLSNTWGDRNRDGRMNADFMMGEIEAGARLGIEVVQLDDGWQKGTTSNSVHAQTAGGVWEGFYNADPDFWTPHPQRFPDGLEPLAKAAHGHGMRLGLWFAPDSTDDFARYEQDAETLIGLYRTYGVYHFKIDGVKIRSKKGERNFHALLETVLRGSGGHVTFDLDVTAETRPGYWGLPHVGPIFVENRYTDWHKYWPHTTLRNLWKLAHHVDPLRLRMEWLNNARNTDKYEGDPLAPAMYRPDFLFASVMFSSPLGWFETQSLPASYFEEAAPLIAIWKQHREELFAGTLLPIGDAPDGTTWTGFASVAQNRQDAYVLLLRGQNGVPDWSASVPLLNAGQTTRADILHGDGTAVWDNGVLRVHVPDPLRYLFARVTAD